MNSKNEKSESRSSSFLDFTPIITELTSIITSVITFVVEYMIKLVRTVIVPFVLKLLFGNIRSSKRKAIREEAIYLKTKTLKNDCIGVDLNTKKVVRFSQVPFQRHSLIFGGTGFGKSTAINNIIDYNLQRGSPILSFDPKANLSAIIEFVSQCEYYGQTPVIFSETSYGNAKFNPLKNLNDSQMSTLIENAFEWSDGEARYYRDTTISIITNKVYDEIRACGKNISLPEIFRHMLEHHNEKETSGFLSQLTILMKSPFAKLFEDLDGDAISLMDIIKNKKCVYFGLSVMGYGAISRTIGKLFLGEIQIHIHELGLLYEDNSIGSKNPITIIIDEAGSIYFPELINTQNKGRSSGINLVLATQTVADFEKIDPVLLRQIVANTGCFFTFSQSNNEDAENIAKIIGTYKTTKTTSVTEDGEETEKGSIRGVREYYCHPETIKNLKVGQCVLFTKDPTQNFLLAVRDSNQIPSIKIAKDVLRKKRESEIKIDEKQFGNQKMTESKPIIVDARSENQSSKTFKLNTYIKDNRSQHVGYKDIESSDMNTNGDLIQ
jgi:hypothetical protein